MTDFVRVGPAPASPLATEEFVRMRDGVRLATDIYLPDGDQSPGDTILIRLPYDKSGDYTFIPLIAQYFMARGYRVVAQDVRGKFRSQGQALLFVNEAYDGYDTIDWLSRQRWSNGRVAMWGDSYYGFTQWAAASTGHPALRAISPRVTGTQLGEPVRPGRVRNVEWAVTLMYPLTYFHSEDAFFWELDESRRPYSRQVEEFFDTVGQRSDSYDQWYPNPVRLNRFPMGSPFSNRAIPTLHTIGWWDNCAPLSWADVAEIATRPAWAANHWLRVESMDHESYYLSDTAEQLDADRRVEVLAAALPRMLDPALEFFEVFLRANGSPDDIPRVAWNLAHTGGMRTARSWPPPGVTAQTLWAGPRGDLVPECPQGAFEARWTHDPANPVPSSVDDAFAFLRTRPDEAGLAARGDVLAFVAPVRGSDVDLVGPISARARVATDGTAMDLFIRVLDEAPDGTALRIARGQVHVEDASDGVEVSVDLGQLGYRLRAGHALRVHVCSSDAPEFLVDPGTGDDPWSATELCRREHSIIVGGEYGFALTFSIATRSASPDYPVREVVAQQHPQGER